MQNLNCINLSNTRFENTPFPHMCCSSVLEDGIENRIYNWFETTDEWQLTKADFYTQYEFVVSNDKLPEELRSIISKETIATILSTFNKAFDTKSLEMVSIVAHKLMNSHTIRIHNDYINGEESHRLVIQINPYWDATKGGFLMLFNSPKVEDVSKVIQPLNNSAFGFAISDKSYHAVSTVHNFSRYSIVYTFRENQNEFDRASLTIYS